MAIHLFNATHNSLPWEAIPETLQKVIIDTFRIKPEYAVYKIWKYDNTFVIHFCNMGSFSISSINIDIIKQYDMYIEVPGNQPYLWTLSIKDN